MLGKLEQYRALRNEIKDLEERIINFTTDRVKSRETVQMSDKDPPHLKHNSPVIGYDTQSKKIQEVVAIYKKRIEFSEALCLEIERFIDAIEDSEVRQIIRLRYIDGLPWRSLPDAMGVKGDGSTQLKKAQGYLSKT